MKKIILLFVLTVSISAFAESENEDNKEIEIAELHFGLGSEFNLIGFGISSVNSIVTKHGDFGFGGFFGVNWGIALENRSGLVVWDFYLSYEYPKWFGLFFAYGVNYGQQYSYDYKKLISEYFNTYSEGKSQATVDRSFILIGLQKTFYISGQSNNYTYIPGSYTGPPSTWRSGIWAPGESHGTINLQLGIKINGVGKLEYDDYFYPPSNVNSLLSSVSADDNKASLFIGAKFNFDSPIKIKNKKEEPK